MTRALVVTSVLILASALACRPHPVHPGRSPGLEKYPSARDLYGLAERYRVKHGLPALGIGIVHRGETVGLGMAGERAAGSADWATLDDVFDVASCSKSVTATIAAWLVERGVVQWTTTLGQAFPELGASLHPWYVNATLEQLLRHRAGLGHDMNRNARWAGWHREHAGRSAAEQRHCSPPTFCSGRRVPRPARRATTPVTATSWPGACSSAPPALSGSNWCARRCFSRWDSPR